VAGRCKASQDAQDAWDAGDASLASGRNADGSDAGSVFADDPGRNIHKQKKSVYVICISAHPVSSGCVMWDNLFELI